MSAQESVDSVTTTAGKGLQRFMLTYSPEKSYAAYGEITTRVTDYQQLAALMARFRAHLDARYPQINYKLKQIELGPGGGAKIEARIVGSDPTVLRSIAAQVMDVMYADPVPTTSATIGVNAPKCWSRSLMKAKRVVMGSPRRMWMSFSHVILG